MGIVFFCQSCGARFEVDPRMAGKAGRCKKCGQQMEIPRAEQIASMAAMPALAGSGGRGRRPGSWCRRLFDGCLAQDGGDQPGGPGPAHGRSDADPQEEGGSPRRGRGFEALCAGPARSRGSRAGEGPGQRRLDALEAASRRCPEDLPQDQPGGLPDLGPVPDGPAARHLGEEPADGDARGGRGGPAQYRGAHLRRSRPGRSSRSAMGSTGRSSRSRFDMWPNPP